MCRSMTAEEFRDFMRIDEQIYEFDGEHNISNIIGIKVGSQVIPVDGKKSWHIKWTRNPDGSIRVTGIKFKGEKAIKFPADSSHKKVNNTEKSIEPSVNSSPQKFNNTEKVIELPVDSFSGNVNNTEKALDFSAAFSSGNVNSTERKSTNQKKKSPNSLFYLFAKRKMFNKIFEDLRLKYRDDIFEEYLRNNGKEFSFWFNFCVENGRVSFYKFDETYDGDLSKIHRYYLSDYRLPNIPNEEERLNFDFDLIHSVVNNFELAFKNPGRPLLPDLNFIEAPSKLTKDHISMVLLKFNR